MIGDNGMTNKAVRYGIVSIAVVLLVMVLLAGSASAGDIYIASAEEWGENITNFENMVNGDTIHLTGDLDFSGKDKSEIVVSNFKGSLDGYDNGVYHTISNFSLSSCTLLGTYGGESICNVTISNCSVSGGIQFVGVIAGSISSICRIENLIIAYSEVDGDYYTGMICGGAYSGKVEIVNCTVKYCKVSGNGYVGGLIGSAYPKSVYVTATCLYNCDISGKNNGIGGLFGRISSGDVYISESWVDSCNILGYSEVGGLVGILDTGCENFVLEDSGVDNCVVKTNTGYSGGCLGVDIYVGDNDNTVDNCTVRNSVIYSTSGSYPCGGIIGGCKGSGTPTNYPDVSNCTVEFCTIAGQNSNPVGGIAGTFPTLGTLDRNEVISSCVVSVSGNAAGICPTATTAS